LAYDNNNQEGWGRVMDVFDIDDNGFLDVVYGVKANDNTWFTPMVAMHMDLLTWQASAIMDTLQPSTPADQYNYFNEAYFFFERTDADGNCHKQPRASNDRHIGHQLALLVCNTTERMLNSDAIGAFADNIECSAIRSCHRLLS
jgi:hypothetical protein